MKTKDILYLTAKQFAARLGISDARVRRMCLDGRVPGATAFGYMWSIPETAISVVVARKKKWLDARRKTKTA